MGKGRKGDKMGKRGYREGVGGIQWWSVGDCKGTEVEGVKNRIQSFF